MDTGRQALVLFYAIFWAAALNVTSRYQSFDTPSMITGDSRALRRFVASIFIINILPLGWFILLYRYLIPNTEGLVSIVAAAVASVSVFGFHRILHACIASERIYHYFYTDDQISDVRFRGKFTQPQTFIAHFAPGVLYIIIFGGLAWLIGAFR